MHSNDAPSRLQGLHSSPSLDGRSNSRTQAKGVVRQVSLQAPQWVREAVMHGKPPLTQIKTLAVTSTSNITLVAYQESDGTAHLAVVKQYFKARMSPAQHRQVYKEARIHLQLCHPFVLPLYAFYEDVGIYYMLMRNEPGGDLTRFFGSHKVLSEDACVQKVLAPLLSALSYVHERGFVHRDVKLENILMGKGGITLADFGLASALTDPPPGSCGTLNYLPPEILDIGLLEKDERQRAKELASSESAFGFAGDIWAVGVVAHELCAGELPFRGKNMREVREAIQRGHCCPEGFSPALASFLREALDPDPNRRPSARKLLEHPWIKSNAPEFEPASIPYVPAEHGSPFVNVHPNYTLGRPIGPPSPLCTSPSPVLGAMSKPARAGSLPPYGLTGFSPLPTYDGGQPGLGWKAAASLNPDAVDSKSKPRAFPRSLSITLLSRLHDSLPQGQSSAPEGKGEGKIKGLLRGLSKIFNWKVTSKEPVDPRSESANHSTAYRRPGAGRPRRGTAPCQAGGLVRTGPPPMTSANAMAGKRGVDGAFHPDVYHTGLPRTSSALPGRGQPSPLSSDVAGQTSPTTFHQAAPSIEGSQTGVWSPYGGNELAFVPVSASDKASWTSPQAVSRPRSPGLRDTTSLPNATADLTVLEGRVGGPGSSPSLAPTHNGAQHADRAKKNFSGPPENRSFPRLPGALEFPDD